MRLAEALLDHGQQPPPPVVGAILLDTAASGTCISQTAAERLGLKPTRMGVGYGAGGRHENPVYFARLETIVQLLAWLHLDSDDRIPPLP